jgi:hypothetical protein
MVGGIVRAVAERAADPEVRHQLRERGVLYGSGLIAGGGVTGIIVAALFNASQQRQLLTAAGEPVSALTAMTASFYDFINVGHAWAGGWAGVVALLAFGLLTLSLVMNIWPLSRRGRK